MGICQLSWAVCSIFWRKQSPCHQTRPQRLQTEVDDDIDEGFNPDDSSYIGDGDDESMMTEDLPTYQSVENMIMFKNTRRLMQATCKPHKYERKWKGAS
jgi:hypothetical protein